MFHMIYVLEGEGTGALVNEEGEETPFKTGDFALVNPEGLARATPKGSRQQSGLETPVPDLGKVSCLQNSCYSSLAGRL